MYSLSSLCAETGVSPRTVRLWRQRRLLSPPRGGRGVGAFWTDEHVRELRALLRLRDERRVFADLGAFLAEEGITITDYLARMSA